MLSSSWRSLVISIFLAPDQANLHPLPSIEQSIHHSQSVVLLTCDVSLCRFPRKWKQIPKKTSRTDGNSNEDKGRVWRGWWRYIEGHARVVGELEQGLSRILWKSWEAKRTTGWCGEDVELLLSLERRRTIRVKAKHVEWARTSKVPQEV